MRNSLRTYSFFLLILILLNSAVSCTKADPASIYPPHTGEHFELNNWIKRYMDLYYFWNDVLPDETDGNVDPTVFFYSLLSPEDNYSNISDDAKTYLNEMSGSSYTAGYSPAFGRFNNSDNVFIIVRFVYPNTPAEKAGLKRGDIILRINGQQLNINNYIDLYYSDNTTETVTLGRLNNNSITTGNIITLNKEQLNLNPIVLSKTFDHDGKKTGYIFYSRFVSGPSNQFVNALQDTLSSLQAEGISDLIIDLRYNPGGTISSALVFGNALAPVSATLNEEVFVKFQYNDGYEQYVIEQEGLDSENLALRFSESAINLNLNRIYVLTTGSTASASELLIIGLSPYMDVIQIGQSTYGKFFGSSVVPNHKYNYAISPVVLKYANALGFTDFANGLPPDYLINEDLLDTKPIGDPADHLLAKALELITGEAPPAKAPVTTPYILLENPVELKKGNTFFPNGKFK